MTPGQSNILQGLELIGFALPSEVKETVLLFHYLDVAVGCFDVKQACPLLWMNGLSDLF